MLNDNFSAIYNSKAQIIYEIVVLATGFGEFEFSRTFWRMWNFFDICVLSIWFSRIFLTFLEYQFEFYRTFWHRYVGFNLKFSALSLRKFEFSRLLIVKSNWYFTNVKIMQENSNWNSTYRKTSLISRGLYKILQLFTAANQRVRPNIECGL